VDLCRNLFQTPPLIHQEHPESQHGEFDGKIASPRMSDVLTKKTRSSTHTYATAAACEPMSLFMRFSTLLRTVACRPWSMRAALTGQDVASGTAAPPSSTACMPLVQCPCTRSIQSIYLQMEIRLLPDVVSMAHLGSLVAVAVISWP